jgi:iron complex transport system permease protein
MTVPTLPDRLYWLTLPGLYLLTALLFVLSLAHGASGLGIMGWHNAGDAETRRLAAIILLDIRLPRALLGVLIGAALGTAGAALQGLLRNPLADPGVIGVSASASLGATLAFYSGLGAALPLAPALAPVLGGMAGAGVSLASLYLLAGHNASAERLILIGAAISGMAGALTSLTLSLAPNPFAFAEALFWLLGSLADRSLDHARIAAPFMLVGMGCLWMCGRGLSALSLGEVAAHSLGHEPRRIALLVIVGAGVAVGAATAVAGGIGFIGLMTPHLLRPLARHRPDRLVHLCAPGGAVLLLAADLAARFGPHGQELKLGVVTALIGAPFFLMLILRDRRIA